MLKIEYEVDADGNVERLLYEITKNGKTKKGDVVEPNPLPYVKGCGETITERAEFLNKYFFVEVGSFISYVMTRAVLSEALFGTFDFKYLQREWYPLFLEKLEQSEYKNNYEYFVKDEYGIVHYWRLFK